MGTPARWSHRPRPAAVRPGQACTCLLLSERPFLRTEGLSRARGRGSPQQPAPKGGVPSTQLWAVSVPPPTCHHLVPREERCQVPSLGHTLLRVSEPQNDIREVRRSGLHPQEDPRDKLSPPLCSAKPHPGARERKKPGSSFPAQPRRVPQLSVFQQTQPPTQSPLALPSCFGPSVQHQPHGPGPEVPRTRLLRTPVPGPHTRSHRGSAVPTTVNSWLGRRHSCGPSPGGGARAALVHKEVTAAAAVFRPRDGPGMPGLGHGDADPTSRTQVAQRDSAQGQGARNRREGPGPPGAPPTTADRPAPGALGAEPQARPAPAPGRQTERTERGRGRQGHSEGVSLRQQNGERGGSGGSGERSPRLPLLSTIKRQFLPQPPR